TRSRRVRPSPTRKRGVQKTLLACRAGTEHVSVGEVQPCPRGRSYFAEHRRTFVTMNHRCYRATVAAGFASMLLLSTGCQKSLPPETDPQKARTALTAALDAWKDGRSPE